MWLWQKFALKLGLNILFRAMDIYQVRGIHQQERVGGYCVSMKQSLHNSATEPRGLEHAETFLIS